MFLKDMNFSEPTQRLVLELPLYLEIRIINQVIFFVSYFPFYEDLLLLIEAAVLGCSKIFRKATGKNSLIDFVFSNDADLNTAKDFFMIIFWNYHWK